MLTWFPTGIDAEGYRLRLPMLAASASIDTISCSLIYVFHADYSLSALKTLSLFNILANLILRS